MARNIVQIRKDIQKLREIGFDVEPKWDFELIHVVGLELPHRGTWAVDNRKTEEISILIDIPPDWPLHPPGIGSSHPTIAIHIPCLYHNGFMIRDLYRCNHYPWYWLCFEEIYWEPEFGLIGLLQIIEKSIWERAK